ncbi:leukocyte elastase inhibitor-like [Pholidichthys leucotaenia]
MVCIKALLKFRIRGKIKTAVGQNILDATTLLVLVTAIYFKGNWALPFSSHGTYEEMFRINKMEKKPVKMMRQDEKLLMGFICEANCQVIELPYEEEYFSMFIILPLDIEDETTGLEKLEKLLTYDKLVEWTRSENMSRVDVQVKIPKFKVEGTYELKDVLTPMGMVNAFDATKSDFSGMSARKGLVLSNVRHKALVEVDEKGSSSGTSDIVMSDYCVPGQKFFKADHPFLFFIRHNATMTILFAGRFCLPLSTL